LKLREQRLTIFNEEAWLLALEGATKASTPGEAIPAKRNANAARDVNFTILSELCLFDRINLLVDTIVEMARLRWRSMSLKRGSKRMYDEQYWYGTYYVIYIVYKMYRSQRILQYFNKPGCPLSDWRG
jgi:hypothetical protein